MGHSILMNHIKTLATKSKLRQIRSCVMATNDLIKAQFSCIFNTLPVWRNGRRYRLKICCPFGRVGSSPSTGTKQNYYERTDGRVVEGTGLENRQGGNSFASSNLALSATSKPKYVIFEKHRFSNLRIFNIVSIQLVSGCVVS